MKKFVNTVQEVIDFMGYTKSETGAYSIYAPHPACVAANSTIIYFTNTLSMWYDWNYLIPVRAKILSDKHRDECKNMGFDNWLDTDIMDSVLEIPETSLELFNSIFSYIDYYNRAKFRPA